MSITFFPCPEDQSEVQVDEHIPELNCHNTGGFILQRAMGLEADYFGRIAPDAQQAAFAKLFFYIHDPESPEYEREYLSGKIDRVIELFRFCLKHNLWINFG